MSKATIKQFRRPSPQPWKLEVPRPLDLEDEFNPSEDDTMEFLITEPDDFMGTPFEEEITTEFKALEEAR